MEFTVSKSDLVRELSLSQGVVEKKTTIPILSNVLLEASGESFPELPQMPPPIAEIPVKTLTSMISRTAFAISMEESRFTLNGALLLMRPEGLTMVATDGHRLALVEQPVDLALEGGAYK